MPALSRCATVTEKLGAVARLPPLATTSWLTNLTLESSAAFTSTAESSSAAARIKRFTVTPRSLLVRGSYAAECGLRRRLAWTRLVRRGRRLHERAFVHVQASRRVIGGARVVRDHHDGLALRRVQLLQQTQDRLRGVAVEVSG